MSAGAVVPWVGALYDDWLADQLLVRDEAELEGTLRFLTEQLALAPGKRVLDQCCGIGTLMMPLAERGLSVVGVDQAVGYIERARGEATRRGLPLEAHAADAGVFVPTTPVDAAFNWWTSFGYGATDAENREMLARAFESLVSGGRFALDTMNVPGVLRHFQRDVVVHRQTARGEVLLLRETTIDLRAGRMNKRWTYFVDGERRVEHPSSVRLYMPEAIVAFFESVGFVDVALFGSIAGEPLGLDSGRLIAVGRRP